MRIVAVSLALLLPFLLPSPAGAAGPRAEIQVSLCEPAATIESRLALRPRGAAYETWLFDSASLAMLDRGLRLRLRTNAKGGDLTLKVANQDCGALPRGAVPKGEGKCEYDVHGEAIAGAVSLSRALDAAQTRDLVAGRTTVDALLSPAQVRYLRDTLQAWPLPEGLRPLGPVANRVYASSRYDVDVSTLPGGQRYTEIADKVPLERVAEEREKLARHLERAGVTVCPSQEGQAAAKMKLLLDARK
ncbi:MAG: hypothetical protein U1F54_03490 [Burkholderiales bacterium]